MKTLVLGLGNELLADDGIGIAAARLLSKEVGAGVEVVESSLAGLPLMDVLSGYERAIIIDAVCTGTAPPGTIIELAPDDIDFIPSPSPHYVGLPEMIRMADQLGLEFPKEIRIIAIETADLRTIGGEMSRQVKDALENVVNRVKKYLA